MEYRSETHRKLESRKYALRFDVFFIGSIVNTFCTEHIGDAAVHWALFHNNWANEIDIMDNKYFVDWSLR